jgi:dTDP-4-amino-4,6-dideoxygalactose transaminase
MFHDVVGGERNHIPEPDILPGINFRMPELLGAVALVQLRRLDLLLDTMRRNKQILKDSLTDVAKRKGISFRKLHDPQGDTASLWFLCSGCRGVHRAAAPWMPLRKLDPSP